MSTQSVPYSLVVVGGGMAGVMAALAAQGRGQKTLIIEPSNVLGGQGTAGGVAGFCGDTQRVNREFATLVELLHRHGLIEPYRANDDRRAYDLEWCAFFLQEMIASRGIDVLFHARVVGVAVEERRIQSLTVATPGGLETVSVRFVVDATGACTIGRLAGFPVQHLGAGVQLPMSLYFTMWDTGRSVTPVLPEGCPLWHREDEIPMTSLHVFPTGKVEVKMKVVGFDAANAWDRSRAEMFARRQMHGLIHFLQTVGYQGQRLDRHVLAGVSRSIGVREENRIVGEHVLTEAEARHGVIFADAVAINTYHIDYHWPDRMERAGTGVTDMLDPHHLPLRMMIPKGAKNLLVPGRGASGDQMAMSAFRVMAVVAQMGYAAGHAARICLEEHVDLEHLSVPKLQSAIEAGGQSLDLSDYGEYLCDQRLTVESFDPQPSAAGTIAASVLAPLENGCFLFAWTVAGPAGNSVHMACRREKQWTEAVEVAQVPATPRIGIGVVTTERGTFALQVWDRDGIWAAQQWRLQQTADGRVQMMGALPPTSKREPTGPDELGQDAGKEGVRMRATITADPRRIEVLMSPDLGSTWICQGEVDAGTAAVASAAAAPTATGVAVSWIAANGRGGFWHGGLARLDRAGLESGD